MWARIAGPLRSLDFDHGDFAELWEMLMGHAVQKGCSVLGVGRVYLVPGGVSIVGPRGTDGSVCYGVCAVCRPCFGDGACGWLEGGGGMC